MATKELDIIVKLRDAASRGLKTVKNNVTGVGKATTTATKGLKGMYGQLVAIAGVVAGGALFGKAIKDFAAFDDNMRAAGAVTGATRKEMELMTETAERMGRQTRYTSAQSAEALRFLGMAGLDAAEAVGALPGVLELAAAGALDLGQAADITTNILAAFGLEIKDLSRVNDVLVKTFTSSNVNLIEIGEAFKIVGPIAKGVGANFEDLVGTIGALGSAGIKGTMAGTALKGAIGALLNPTAQEAKLLKDLESRLGGVALKIKDSEGDFVGFEKILVQLEKAGLRGDEALKLFGERAGPGIAALLNMGSEALAELIDKLETSGGTAKRISEEMEAGIGGSIRKTISVLEALKNTIGKAFGDDTMEVLSNFRTQIMAIQTAIKDLHEDGSLKGWAEDFNTIMNAAFFLTKKLTIGLSAFISVQKIMWRTISGDFEGAGEALDDYFGKLKRLYAEIIPELENKNVLTFKIDPLERELFGAEWQKDLEDLAGPGGPIGKGTKKISGVITDKIINFPFIEAKMKAGMIRLNALLKNESEIIEGDYAQGLINLNEYYDERAEIVRRKIQAEIAILSARVTREGDVSKRTTLNAQIFAKQKQLDTELLKLSNDRIKAQESLDKKRLREDENINSLRLRAEKAYQDQKARIKDDDFVTALDAQFAEELAKLQTKQNKELEIINNYHKAVLQSLRDRKASEEEIEKAHEDKKAAITEQQRIQEQEKNQQAADQELRLSEYKLNNFIAIAGGTADALTQLYELSGRKSKELFYLSKAASLAEATMKVAQGVAGALGSPPYGPGAIANAAIIGTLGAIQIAAIASQGLADGGEVQGYSPNAKADNIPAMLTAKEFVQPVSSVQHYGKDIMEGLRRKSIPKSIFNGYASGGYVKSSRSHFADGGLVSSSNPNIKSAATKDRTDITLINVTDPREIDQYLNTPAGQNAVLNVISSRAETVRRIVR